MMAADVAPSVRILPEYYPIELRERYNLYSTPSSPPKSDNPSVQLDWYPDRLKYEQRCRSQRNVRKTALRLPDGWPTHLQSPLAWNRNDFEHENTYIYKLDSTELAIVSDALAYFKSLNLHPSKSTVDTFPLGVLGRRLQELSEEVHYGKGFLVIRGLQPQDHDIEENSVIYLGISSYIANRRGRQNIFGQMIHHIINASDSQIPTGERQSIYSNVSQPFHADVCCDILALFWIGVPEHGGETAIASSWTVYNELAKNRPDLIRVLAAKDWIHNTFNFVPPFYSRPLLFLNNQGRPILNFSRRVLTGNKATPRSPSAPPISRAQAEALDAVHFTAQENCLKMKPQLGDMRFINNFSILHSRDDFQDSPRNKRHVLRLWLRNDKLGWSIPSGLRLAWERVFEPLRSVPEEWDVTPSMNPGQRVKIRPPHQSADCG